MDTDAQRKKLIQAEREKYFLGEGKSYSWNDVKEMAMNKEKRNATIEIIESGYIKKLVKCIPKSFQFPALYSIKKYFNTSIVNIIIFNICAISIFFINLFEKNLQLTLFPYNN